MIRTITRRTLLGLGIVFLLASLLASYAQVVLISDSGFADTAVAALDHQNVRTALSQVIVSKLLTGAPRLQGAEPILEQATATVLNSDRFKSLFRATAYHSHHVILSERGNQIVLDLSRSAATVLGVLSLADPQLAQQLQPAQARLKRISQSNALIPLIRLLQRIRWIEIVAPILAVACFLVAIYLGTDRRRALRNAGIAITIPAGVVWLLLALGQWATPHFVSSPLSLALPGLWDAFLGDLRRWSLILVLAGLVLVAIANASSRTMDLTIGVRNLKAWLTTSEPHARRGPILGVAAVVAGLLLVFEPLALVRLSVVLAGVLAVYWGTYSALQLLGATRISYSVRPQSDGTVGIARWSAVAVVAVAVVLLWVRNIWLA